MSRYAIRSSLAALGFIVAATGMSGTVMAASETAPTAAETKQNTDKLGERHGHYGDKHGHRHGGKHGYHHRAEMRDGFFVPGVGPLSKTQVESLKLDAKQQASFDEAKQAQTDMFKAMREHGGKRHELLATQLQDGKLDPHALIADEDARREKFREQSTEVRGKWLAAWDSLNSTQHQQVTEWVKERQTKLEARKAKRQERLAQRQARHDAKAADEAKPAPATSAN